MADVCAPNLTQGGFESRPYVTVKAGVLDPATVGDGSLIGVGDDGGKRGAVHDSAALEFTWLRLSQWHAVI